MKRRRAQILMYVALLFILGCMIAASLGESANAAQPNPSPTPYPPSQMVISEFRSRGPNGDNDEFVELYNPTGAAINIGYWTIKSSSDCGTAVTILATIPYNTILQAGQHYLLASYINSSINGADQIFSPGLTDAGGVALVSNTNVIIDQVGMCMTTFYREGTNLQPITTNGNQSYERLPGGATACYDTNNNASDFVLISPPNPQDQFTPITLCGGVIPYTPTLTLTTTLTRTRTSTRTPTRTATTVPGSVIINEFLPHPHSDWNEDGATNVGDEYIELLNMGVTNINIQYWQLDNGANTTAYVLPDINMLPHQILVFFHSETGIPLSDGGGTVRLLKSDGHTADIFNYPPVEAMDRTWCRLSSGKGFLEFVCQPSPGRPNAPSNPTPTKVEMTSTPGKVSGCNLTDTIPASMTSAECNGTGAGVWNSPLETEFWLLPRWKWPVFIE
jgi:Lamin Tail Domain